MEGKVYYSDPPGKTQRAVEGLEPSRLIYIARVIHHSSVTVTYLSEDWRFVSSEPADFHKLNFHPLHDTAHLSEQYSKAGYAYYLIYHVHFV